MIELIVFGDIASSAGRGGATGGVQASEGVLQGVIRTFRHAHSARSAPRRRGESAPGDDE